MKNTSKTVIFFGSGPVAAASLEFLAPQFDVIAVVTKPAPPHHHGPVPVVELASKLGLKTLIPEDRPSLTALFKSEAVSADVGIVIDYGIIIDQSVIDVFPLGIVNSHFSLLPEWRGADPITFSVLSGQQRTGVSLMLINDKLDEGLLLAQSPYDIPPDCTTPELTDSLVDLSNKTLAAILPLYLAGEVTPQPQETGTIGAEKSPSYSRRLTKADGVIEWVKPAVVLEREIRAYSGWPKSTTKLAGRDIVILKAKLSEESGKAGSIQATKQELQVFCGTGSLIIERLQPAGKPAMTSSAFLAGYRSLL